MHFEALAKVLFGNHLSELTDEKIRPLLDALTGRERDIITRRFGLFTGRKQSSNEVGRLYGISGNRVRQVEAKTLRKLKRTLSLKLKEKDPVTWQIEHLNLSVRTFNCLKREGITTVGELITHTATDLLWIRNFGRRCLAEVQGNLAFLGLSLKC